MKNPAQFLKEKEKKTISPRKEFTERTGVALTVVRKIEQGKENLNYGKGTLQKVFIIQVVRKTIAL